MACGNTFGATALSSYGGFWISYAILLIPDLQLFAKAGPYEGNPASVVGFFLMGWFIFTFLLLMCTLRSTVMFFLLFFTLDLAFLCLGTAEFAGDNGNMAAANGLKKAGGLFGFLAAFLAWYLALVGMQDSRYVFVILSCHVPTLTNFLATPSSLSPSSTSPGLTTLRHRERPASPRLSRLKRIGVTLRRSNGRRRECGYTLALCLSILMRRPDW